MSEVLNGKVVLVTGGTGSIGSEIVKQALEQGASKVIVLSRDETKHFVMRKAFAEPRLDTVVSDVRDMRGMERVFNSFDVDVLYHVAAMKHLAMCEDFPVEAVNTNIVGTQNVVDMALKYGVGKTITVSTDKAASPSSVLGACKFVAERITLNADRASGGRQVFSCVRFGNVANSRGSVIPVFVEGLCNRKRIEMTDPGVTRFIMRIPDAARLVIAATEQARGGEIFVLRMKAFRLGDLVDVLRDRIAPRLGISSDSILVDMKGLVPGEKLHEDLIGPTESAHLYELGDMYVILSDSAWVNHYPSIVKARLTSYSSADTEMITKDEIESIVVSHLERESWVA